MLTRRVVSWLSTVSLAALAAGVLAAQSADSSQPRNTPRFRSGIAVLRLDASVVDNDGRAIGDLGPEDFQVTLDGRPRKVVFAKFTGIDKASTPVAPATAASIPTYAVNTQLTGGRAIVLMVDLESINAGSERPLLDTAAQLVEKLRPIDAVAVVPLPGKSVDLTRDHRQVADAIRTLRGTSQTSSYQYSFTLEEALAFERRDTRVIAEVIERECRPEPGRAQRGLQQTCPPDLRRDAAERLRTERLHIEMVLSSIVSVAKQLRNVPAPASIVLISGGLGFEQRSLSRLQEVQRALRDAGISIAAVQVDRPAVDVSSPRGVQASDFGSHELQAGLANIASMTGGAFYAGIGTAKGVFERLRTELTEAYELGVEAEPGDLDGKPHELRVTTTKNATVRARRYFASEEPASDWPARLAKLITQPVDVSDLPIALAAHSVRGDELTTLKVLIRADIAHGLPTIAPVRYAALIIGADDTLVMNTTGVTNADGAVLLSTQLVPGQYRLRMGAIDGTGRAGTVEVPILVAIRSAGGLQLSDVIVGTESHGALAPSIYATAGKPLIPTLELSTEDVSRFARTRVAFEIRRAGIDNVVAAGEARLESTIYERQQIARGLVATDALTPGEYVLSAIVKIDGLAAGRVSRMFVVEPGNPRVAPVAAPPTSGAPAPDADPAAPSAIADAALAELMNKVAGYVATYGEQMSAVVGVEKYTQSINPSGAAAMRSRQLLAEFALVKSGGPVPWTGYRDVIEVNGQPVHDRRDRLLKIVAESANPIEEAARLTAESARYNIGPVSRNFNLPTTALFFFHESNLSRFTFTRKGTKRVDGVEVVEIAFRELRRPTLITTRDGSDVPCEGTLWVLPADGTIVRTRLQLKGFADSVGISGVRPQRTAPAPAAPPPPVTTPAPTPAGGTQTGGSGTQTGGTGGGRGTGGDANRSGLRDRFADAPDLSITKLESSADIDVTYRRDAKLGMWLPVRMSEEYQGAIPRINNPPILGTSRSIATYSDYKRFGTSTAVITPKK